MIHSIKTKICRFILLSNQKTSDLQKENKALRDMIKRQDAAARHEQSLWRTRDGSESGAAGEPALLHRVEVLDEIIRVGKNLHDAALKCREQFQYVLDRAEAWIRQSGKSPLFRSDETRASDPGNHCKLYPRHALLMALMYKKGNPTQGVLAAFFGIDQATVSRYIDVLDEVLEAVLPTATNISKEIADTETKEDLKKIISGPDGGIMMIDGTHCPIQRPDEKQMRSMMYSGKKKKFTLNTTVCINENGVIVAISGSTVGSVHDITLLRESPLPFGKWWDRMCDENTPEEDRIHTLTDRGYKGIAKDLPGTNTLQPHKKTKNHKRFTKEEKEHNHKINSARVKVEHSIGRLKRYGRLTAPYKGKIGDFNREFNIIAGLVNLDLVWNYLEKGPPSGGTLGPVINWEQANAPGSSAVSNN